MASRLWPTDCQEGAIFFFFPYKKRKKAHFTKTNTHTNSSEKDKNRFFYTKTNQLRWYPVDPRVPKKGRGISFFAKSRRERARLLKTKKVSMPKRIFNIWRNELFLLSNNGRGASPLFFEGNSSEKM